MSSIWSIILKEILISAAREAIKQEFGEKGSVIADIIENPESAAKKIMDDAEEKAGITESLTGLFRCILRVFK